MSTVLIQYADKTSGSQNDFTINAAKRIEAGIYKVMYVRIPETGNTPLNSVGVFLSQGKSTISLFNNKFNAPTIYVPYNTGEKAYIHDDTIPQKIYLHETSTLQVKIQDQAGTAKGDLGSCEILLRLVQLDRKPEIVVSND